MESSKITDGTLGLESNEDGTWDVLYTSNEAIAGFQFVVDFDDGSGGVVNGSGGDAASKNFIMGISSSLVLGYSPTLNTILEGSGTLVTLDLAGEPTGLSNIVVSDDEGQAINLTYDNGSASTTAESSVDIMYYSDAAIAGFQFHIDSGDILGASGGAAEDHGFHVSYSPLTMMVLGFDWGGATVPPGNGILTTLLVSGDSPCLDAESIVFGDSDASNMGATVSDADCLTIVIGEVDGCMDIAACNYNPVATVDNGTCILESPICWDNSSVCNETDCSSTPIVVIEKPMQDEIIVGTSVDVEVSTTNAMIGTTDVTGAQHYHVYLNEAAADLEGTSSHMAYDNNFTLENVVTGDHTLTVKLADSAHVEYQNISGEVSFSTLPGPDWVDIPSNYENTASMTAVVVDALSGEQMGEAGDILAAFDDEGDVRGIALQLDVLEIFPSDYAGTILYEIQIRGDASGDAISFKYYDASEDEVLDSSTGYTFVIDDIIGDVVDPHEISVGAVELTIDIAPGWNWFSLNVEGDDMSMSSVMNSLTSTDGDFIKNASASSTYYPDYGWYGGLKELGMTGMYKFSSANADSLAFTGSPVDPLSTPISLAAGWNWVGFTPQNDGPTSDALSTISTTIGDFIKNQEASSTYYDNFGWYGGLEVMAPTEGYMLYVAEASTYSYPIFEHDDARDEFLTDLDDGIF